MKRLVLILAAVMLLFCSCGGDAVDLTAVEAAVNAPATRVRSSFTLNVVFGDERTTLLFAMGSFDADYSENLLSAKMTRTVLASASSVALDYDGTTCTTVIDGDEHVGEASPDDIFGGLIYARPIFPDGCKITATLSADGLYTVKCKNPDSQRLFDLLGDDIYSIACINVPRRDKMYCENAVFTYRIRDGVVTDYGLSYTVHLFDTPPYVPGGKVDESDYELELEVNYVCALITTAEA